MLPSDDTLKANRDAYEASADRNIFVIMRYGSDRMYRALERAIKETVRSYGFEAKLARDMLFYGELWRNIEFFMKNSRYGQCGQRRIPHVHLRCRRASGHRCWCTNDFVASGRAVEQNRRLLGIVAAWTSALRRSHCLCYT